MQLLQGFADLVLIGTGRALHRHGHVRLGEVDSVENERPARRGQRVVGSGLLELCHHPDVPRMQPGHLQALPSQGYGNVVQLLVGAATRVVRFHPVDRDAAEHAEVREFAHMRLGRGLEDQCRERPVVGRLEFRFLVESRTGGGVAARLGGVREELDHLAQQRPDPVDARRGSAENRDHLIPLHRDGHGFEGFLARDLLTLQIPVQEFLVGGREGFLQFGGPLLEDVLEVGGNVGFVVFAGDGTIPIHVRAPAEQVDDPAEVGSRAHGYLHRQRAFRELLPDVLEYLAEVGVLLVHHRNEEHARDAALLAVAPHPFGPDLHAGGRAHHDDGRVRHPNRRQGLPGEVQVPGRVDQVDLGSLPLAEGGSELHRDPVLDLLGGGHGEGMTFRHIALAPRGAPHEGEGVHQHGLAGAAVAEYGHVANVLRQVFLPFRHLTS